MYTHLARKKTKKEKKGRGRGRRQQELAVERSLLNENQNRFPFPAYNPKNSNQPTKRILNFEFPNLRIKPSPPIDTPTSQPANQPALEIPNPFLLKEREEGVSTYLLACLLT